MPATRTSPLAAAILTALASMAPTGATGEQSLAPVSVTAKGYAAEDIDTPIATTALDREELLRRNAQNPGEALRGEPGIAVASDGAQGQNPVIRGLKKESVVLLVDGMRLNSAQPAGAVASFISLGLADRIEVVKGPASVLYGTGALGGALNVLLPQARFEPGAKFSAAASYDSASRGLRGTGILNASGGDHALMLGASLARIGDYKAPDGRGHWLKAGLSVVRGTNNQLDEPLLQMPADELTLGWEGGVAAGWTMDVTGRFVRRQDRVATVFSRGSENATPGFATADIGATWRYAKSQSLRIGVKNLFDREYHEHLTEGVSGQEFHMPGRSLVLSWKGDF